MSVLPRQQEETGTGADARRLRSAATWLAAAVMVFSACVVMAGLLGGAGGAGTTTGPMASAPAMRSAAAGLMLGAAGLFMLARGRPGWAMGLATASGLVGLTALIEMIPGVGSVVGRHGSWPVTVTTKSMWRELLEPISPNWATCLVLCWLSLLATARGGRGRLAEFAAHAGAAATAALAAAALVGLALDAPLDDAWGRFVQSAPTAAWMFMGYGLGIAAMAAAGEKRETTRPHPAAAVWAGLAVAATTVCVWQSLRSNEATFIERETERAAGHVAKDIEAILEEQGQILRAMEARSAIRNRDEEPAREEWTRETKLLVGLYPSLVGMEWVGPEGDGWWREPALDARTSESGSGDWNARRQTALNQARLSDRPVTSRTVETGEGEPGILTVLAVRNEGRLEGFLIAEHDIGRLVSAAVREIMPQFSIEFLDGDAPLAAYGTKDEALSKRWGREEIIDARGAHLVVRVWPAAGGGWVTSILPEVGVLGGGLLLATATGALVYLRQQARIDTGVMKRVGDQLRVEAAERERALRALEESEGRFHTLVDNLPGAAYRAAVDADRALQYISDGIKEICGYPASDFVGRQGRRFVDLVNPDDLEEIRQAVVGAVEGGRAFEVEYRLRHADGEWRNIRERGRAVHGPDGRAMWIDGIVLDVSAHRNAEMQLRHQSLTDRLTGLPNRVQLTDILQQAIRRLDRVPTYRFALLILDFDRFKVIYDSLGLEAGDHLLIEVGERLRQQTRGNDVALRLGGDEFAMFLDGLWQEADATQAAKRLLTAVSRPYVVAGHEVSITASMGIVFSHGRYQNPTDMMRDADSAMYRAKAEGGARCVVFGEQMHDAAMERLRVENGLRKALERHEFYLLYQPIVAVESGRLEGFESLVRWNRPEYGTMSPAEFIPTAEETGLIIPIGEWVLREACRQVREWHERYPRQTPLFMSVNMSKRQLTNPGIVEVVQRILAETGMDPSALKLEITESVIMDDAESVAPRLEELRKTGVRLAIDDFGTGQSSLSCLHRFPISDLKVDRAFIMNMSTRRDYAAINHAIVTVAHNLGLHVIAEGIETREQLALLQALECDSAQGYLFARPLTAEAAERMVAEPQKVNTAA